MKFRTPVFISFIICILAFVVLTAFRTVPVSRLWKGYQVLYVSSQELSENAVLAILQKNGCRNVISRNSQRIPVVSQFSPVQLQGSDSYLTRRGAFFTDETHTLSLFYVPEAYSSALDKSLRELAAFQNTKAGTDGKSSMPWIPPLFCLFFCFVCFIFARKKLVFMAGSAYLLLFAFSRPLYTVAAASCMNLLGLFLLNGIWRRTGFVKTFLNSFYVISLMLLPVLLLFLSAPSNAFFYILATAASFCVLYLFNCYEDKKEVRFVFNPVYIRNSKMIPIMGRTGVRLMMGLAVFVSILFFASFSVGKIGHPTVSSTRPALPAPVHSEEAKLPSIDDFTVWCWNTVTFPYRRYGESFNPAPTEGESVFMDDYVENDGRIEEISTPVYTYDDAFRDSIYATIEGFDYPAIEKLLLKQGKNVQFGFSKSSGTASEKFSGLILLVFILVPAFLAGYYIIGRKKYGLSI